MYLSIKVTEGMFERLQAVKFAGIDRSRLVNRVIMELNENEIAAHVGPWDLPGRPSVVRLTRFRVSEQARIKYEALRALGIPVCELIRISLRPYLEIPPATLAAQMSEFLYKKSKRRLEIERAREADEAKKAAIAAQWQEAAEEKAAKTLGIDVATFRALRDPSVGAVDIAMNGAVRGQTIEDIAAKRALDASKGLPRAPVRLEGARIELARVEAARVEGPSNVEGASGVPGSLPGLLDAARVDPISPALRAMLGKAGISADTEASARLLFTPPDARLKLMQLAGQPQPPGIDLDRIHGKRARRAERRRRANESVSALTADELARAENFLGDVVTLEAPEIDATLIDAGFHPDRAPRIRTALLKALTRGQRARRARVAVGLSREKIAQLAGLSEAEVAAHESDRECAETQREAIERAVIQAAEQAASDRSEASEASIALAFEGIE